MGSRCRRAGKKRGSMIIFVFKPSKDSVQPQEHYFSVVPVSPAAFLEQRRVRLSYSRSHKTKGRNSVSALGFITLTQVHLTKKKKTSAWHKRMTPHRSLLSCESQPVCGWSCASSLGVHHMLPAVHSSGLDPEAGSPTVTPVQASV